jgi:tetratricopeptide (TPR) repeat protein
MGTLHLFLGIFTLSIIGLTTLLLLRFFRLKHEEKTQMKMALRNAYKEKVEEVKNEKNEESGKKEYKKRREKKEEIKKVEEKKEKIEKSISPKEISGLRGRAEILVSQAKFPEAEKILVQILAYNDNDTQALSQLGEIYIANECYGKSCLVYEKLLEKKPEHPCFHTNYALSLLHEKDFEKSIHHYEQAAKHDPENPDRHTNLGQLFFTVKNYDAALECFFKSVKIKPRNIEYLYLIADTYRSANRFPEAKKWYEKILEISPYDAEGKKEIERLEALGF